MGISDYILVTPCKNEQESLPKLAQSVVNQTIKPKIWVIVDDGSTDKTPEILQDLTSRYMWIKNIKLSENPRDLGIHVAHVYRTGFDYAITYCKNNNLEYNYIGCVDADITFDKFYFECLINEFEKNEKLGLCSGHGGNIINGKVAWSNFRYDLPSGGARLWREECFKDTGGYLLTCSPDGVSIAKAKLRGWDTRLFENIKFVSTRAHASAEGQWKGHKKLGSNNYFIGFSPLHALLKGIKLLYSRNGSFKTGVGLAYILGYFSEYMRNSPRIKDEEVLDYFKNKKLKESLCSNITLHNAKK